jgi:hypothetical protein
VPDFEHTQGDRLAEAQREHRDKARSGGDQTTLPQLLL